MKQGHAYNAWELNRDANILAFLEAPEFKGRKQVLEEMAQALNDADITWCLCCSGGLFFKGVVRHRFGDFDILVNVENFDKLKMAMAGIGVTMTKTVQKPEFKSPYYQEGNFKDVVTFDLIADFWPATYGTEYDYVLRQQDIDFVKVGEYNIPVLSVEVQLILYGMMTGWQPERELKFKLCAGYLRENGVKNRDVLDQALSIEPALPEFLKEVISDLL